MPIIQNIDVGITWNNKKMNDKSYLKKLPGSSRLLGNEINNKEI